MKLTLIGPIYPYRGGIAHFTTTLAKKLTESGHEIQVISFKKQYPQWLYPGKSDKDFSANREHVDVEYLLAPLNPFTWQKTVTSILNYQPQIVIIPWWVTFWSLAFHHIINRLKKYGIISTFLVHNTLPHEARTIDRTLARWALNQADKFIVMTEKEKVRLLDLLPTKKKNIAVVPHPIYRIFQPSGMNKKKLRKKLGLPEEQPVILFFGFIREYKGLDDLLEAHRILISKGEKIRLVIAGEFWEDINKYRQKIDSLGLKKYIAIYNKYIPDDQAAEYFEMSDLFVAPYRDGTQSGVIKIALGFGVPIVLTDVVVDEIIKHFPELCKIVPSKNPQLLSEGIQEQLKTSPLDSEQIEVIFNKTWESLVKSICNGQ